MTEWLRKAGHWFSIASILIVTVLSIGCRSFEAEPQFSHSPAFSTDESQDISEKYVFQRGDLVTIVLQSADEPFFRQRIQEDGTIVIPSIGSIVAAGCTASQLQKKVAKLDPRFRFPGHDSYIYYITGEVRIPGPKPFFPQLTVSQGVQSAGGFTEFANKKRVTLKRANGHNETVKLGNVSEQDARVFPGDTIIVQRRRFFAP